jgi:hypothetical protein
MSKKDDRDLERPHYYSQYWINIARQAYNGGISDLGNTVEEEDSTPPEVIRPVNTAVAVEEPLDEFEELPLPVPPTPKPSKQRTASQQRASLTSLADLAALGFGADAETEELAVGADDDENDIVSRLESEFDMGTMDEDEADLEPLPDEEDELWDEDEEEEDENGVSLRPPRTVIPPKPPRRPAPRRREF